MASTYKKMKDQSRVRDVVNVCLDKIKESYDVLVSVENIPEHATISDHAKGFFGIGVDARPILEPGISLEIFCKAVESNLIERIAYLARNDEEFKKRNLSVEICVEDNFTTFSDGNLKLPGVSVHIWVFGYLSRRFVIS